MQSHEHNTGDEGASGGEGQIGKTLDSRVSVLETHLKYTATKEWFWKNALLAVIGGISLATTIATLVVKVFQ